MCATAAGATGNPDPLKHPPEQIPPRQRDADEGCANGQMLAERGLETEPRKHHDLRGNGQTVADDHVNDGLDQ
jgi:hypothetical protein